MPDLAGGELVRKRIYRTCLDGETSGGVSRDTASKKEFESALGQGENHRFQITGAITPADKTTKKPPFSALSRSLVPPTEETVLGIGLESFNHMEVRRCVE